MNPNLENPKNPKIYSCKYCLFESCNKKDYSRHLLTPKHENLTNPNKNLTQNTQITQKNVCECICGKIYKHQSTLSAHKKKCVKQPYNNDIIDSNLVVQLLKQNDEIQKQNNEFKNIIIEQNNKILEVCKNNNSNNTIINSNNKAFNLNVFLNEECKDAMDINDFIDSVKLQLSDLELVGKLGFVDGISSIIIKNLKALKVNERPVHCTDMKRETMYVKEQGIWEKQEGDYKNLRKVIKRVAFKNSKNLSLYKELHPDYNDYYSKHSDHYLKLQIEAFGGSGNETIDNENKIIKKIAKEMTIDKSL